MPSSVQIGWTRCRAARAAAPRARAPTARAPGRRTATARTRASRRARRGSARRDRAIGRHAAGRLALLGEVGDQVARRRARRGGARRAAAPAASDRLQSASSSRQNAPSARPSSIGPADPSPRQNGILPGSPGAGETITRSRVMSSMRQVVAPRMNVSPGRLSYTISSSSSPTRGPPGRRGTRRTARDRGSCRRS